MNSNQEIAPVLLAGTWRCAQSQQIFSGWNPATGQRLGPGYPQSAWADCETALATAATAAAELRRLPPERLAEFLEGLAAALETAAEELVALAHAETALPVRPRLAEVELPRTTNQLRQAAAAARDRSWALPTIDSQANIRSCLLPLGPVVVFGPNNFPLAFNSVAGGDFAAALATGCPVIAKANTSHPGVSRRLAELAHDQAQTLGMPAGTVQLLYRTSHADGERLVADPRLGAVAYTGSRQAGLALKRAADRVGKPIYLELSSVNPVLLLPGALAEQRDALAEEISGSCLLGTGQFCTHPGLLLLVAGDDTDKFLAAVAQRFQRAPVGTLLSERVAQSLAEAVATLVGAGARVVVGGTMGGGAGASHANTLLRVSGAEFLQRPGALQTEAFGNATLAVVTDSVAQLAEVVAALEGNLTGSIYSARSGADDALANQLEPALRTRVGRLLNDKMPTGVAVSPAMNHGGPYPATGHPGFTAVGLPAAMRRFGQLACYDNVRPARLPALLADANPTGRAWRWIDGTWTQANVPARGA